MELDHPIPSLQTILDSAHQFGLTDEEIGRTIDDLNDVVNAVGRDMSATEYFDQLSGALARSILSKERHSLPR